MMSEQTKLSPKRVLCIITGLLLIASIFLPLVTLDLSGLDLTDEDIKTIEEELNIEIKDRKLDVSLYILYRLLDTLIRRGYVPEEAKQAFQYFLYAILFSILMLVIAAILAFLGRPGKAGSIGISWGIMIILITTKLKERLAEAGLSISLAIGTYILIIAGILGFIAKYIG